MLAEVPLKADEAGQAPKSELLLLHCEVQGRGGAADLGERMCRYKDLIALRHRKPFTALVLIAEPLAPEQMTGTYQTESFGTVSIYKFNVVKVFEASEELITSDNLFDLAQLAAARVWRANKDEVKRFEYLKELLRILKGKGLSHQELFTLMKFLEMISKIRAPELVEDYLKFNEEFNEEEEETMLMFEQVAMHKGKIEGITEGITIGEKRGEKQGKLTTARNLLAKGVPMELLIESTGLSEKDLRPPNYQKI